MISYHFVNQYRLPIICFIAAAAICTSYSQEISTNDWRPNTRMLDDIAKINDPPMTDAARTLAHDLKRFYQLLRDKQWQETYELRAKAFRKDTPLDGYIAEARQAGKDWGLANYEVLSVGFQSWIGSTNVDEAILICRFTELPGYKISYATVFWHKEDGVWRCMSAGPSRLHFLRGTRPPYMDWR